MELQGFDTLEATRILESVGMETEHAEAVVQVVKSGADNLAVRADISDLKQDVSILKTDSAALKADVAELKSDVVVLKADVAELKIDVAMLKSDVARMDRNMVTKADIKDMVTKADLERQGKKTLLGGITLAGVLFTALTLFG